MSRDKSPAPPPAEAHPAPKTLPAPPAPPAPPARKRADEVVVPGLRFRLDRLAAERDRCHRHAARLARWSMFWKIALMVLGVLVAAQGSFAEVWGDESWTSLVFVGLGVLTAGAAGFDALFRPGERAPRFVSIGYEYERLRDALRLDADALRREADLATDAGRLAFGRSADQLLRRSEQALAGVRERELALYVSGPVGGAARPAEPAAPRRRRRGTTGDSTSTSTSTSTAA